MKYAIVFSAVAAVASAQSVTPVDQLPADVQPVAQAILNINDTTNALDASINAFEGINQVADLQGAAATVLSTIEQSNSDVAALTPLEDTPENQDSAFLLVDYVNGLNGAVGTAVTDLIAKRQLLIDTCVGPIVQEQTVALQSSSEEFIETTFNFIPESLASIGGGVVQPIRDSLSSAVSAFADQTTLPASCSTDTPPDTSSTTTTETGTATETTETTATPTGTQSGGVDVYPTYPTATAYPTGGEYPEEDCDDEEPEESSSYAVWEPVYEPTSAVYPTGGEGGAYPTGGSKPSDSYPTGGEGGAYPTGGSKPSDSYPTGGQGGSYPTGGSKPSDVHPTGGQGGAYPTGGSKPTGTVNPVQPSQPVYTTTKIAVYHGAAVVNGVNFGVAAVAAAALLL